MVACNKGFAGTLSPRFLFRVSKVLRRLLLSMSCTNTVLWVTTFYPPPQQSSYCSPILSSLRISPTVTRPLLSDGSTCTFLLLLVLEPLMVIQSTLIH